VSISKRNERRCKKIVPQDLSGNVAKHKRAKPESFIMKAPSLGEKVEAIYFDRPQKSRRPTDEQQ
jgi:hypothetical protein